MSVSSSNLGNLICVRHWLTSTAVANLKFLHTCATCSESPSDIRTMVQDALDPDAPVYEPVLPDLRTELAVAADRTVRDAAATAG